MRAQLTVLVNTLITFLLILVVAAIPLVFTPLTTEFFEMPKLAFLTASTLLLLLLWSFSWILEGKVIFSRSPLDISLFLLLIIIIASTIFSSSREVSIYGNFPRLHGSAISFVIYILLFFVATSHLKNTLQIKTILYAYLTSTSIVAIVSLLSYFGIYPLANIFAFSKALNFNPSGSSFSASVLMILALPWLFAGVASLKDSQSLLPKIPAIVLATIFCITLALTADRLSLILAAFAISLTIYTVYKKKLGALEPLLLIPIVAGIVIFLIGWVPLGNKINPLVDFRLNFPREIQLPLVTSWQVSASSFRDNPFLGSGPSTYLFDFSAYKPLNHNSSRFWNVRFDSSFNEFFQTLATLGGLGLAALIFLGIAIIVFASRNLGSENILQSSLSISAILVVLFLLIHTTTVVSIVASLIVLAVLMGLSKHSGKVEEVSLGIKTSRSADSSLIAGDALPLILFLPILFLVIYSFWNMASLFQADFYHRLALNSASIRGLDTYNYLVKAESLNPKVDLYRTDLAQTNFALANAIASSKGPTESSPGGSLTDQDKRNIQQLLSQAINEARVAVTLSPRNPQNFEILASIYRQISGVAQNAIDFSLDAYGRAIERDPRNPILRVNVGGIYYSIKNYDLAIRFFTDAINLKPDYANAYYNLSVTLRDKGDLKAAELTAERVLTLINPSSGDYKLAADYLADLKSRIATGSSEQSEISAPAGVDTSALQKKELPKVLDEKLKNKPEKISTPEAVKKE